MREREKRRMDMTRKVLVLLVVAAACVFWAPAASAQCGTSLPFGNILGSYIELCGDAKPVDAVIAAFGASGTTGTANVVCESMDEINQGGRCQVAAGVVGDGKITLNGNYANAGAMGTCPNPGPATGVGRNIYAIRDSNGGGLIISVGFDPNVALYAVENAHRADPASPTHDPLPLSCNPKSVDA